MRSTSTTIYRYDRWGTPLGVVHTITAQHRETIAGEDTLELVCYDDLARGDLLLWQDGAGVWHEHMADRVTRMHDDLGAPYTQAACVNSLALLYLVDTSGDTTPAGDSLTTALSRAVPANAMWQAGLCDNLPMKYNEPSGASSREEIARLVELYNAEIETRITVDGDKVASRTVALRDHIGNSASTLRISYQHDAESIAREVLDEDVYTAVHAYGADGLAVDVTDAVALALWGIPDGNGGKAHAWTSYHCDATDATSLRGLAYTHLRNANAPSITYTIAVANVQGSLGDAVQIEDYAWGAEPLSLSGRITEITRDLCGTQEGVIVVGTARAAIVSTYRAMATQAAAKAAQAAAKAMRYGSNVMASRLNIVGNADAFGDYHGEAASLAVYDGTIAGSDGQTFMFMRDEVELVHRDEARDARSSVFLHVPNAGISAIEYGFGSSRVALSAYTGAEMFHARSIEGKEGRTQYSASIGMNKDHIEISLASGPVDESGAGIPTTSGLPLDQTTTLTAGVQLRLMTTGQYKGLYGRHITNGVWSGWQPIYTWT